MRKFSDDTTTQGGETVYFPQIILQYFYAIYLLWAPAMFNILIDELVIMQDYGNNMDV
jgi:hypothetical protein